MQQKAGTVFSDKTLKLFYEQNETKQKDEEVLSGEVVQDYNPIPTRENTGRGSSFSGEEELRKRIESGEWDNLDDCPAFQKRTPEGQIMARAEAIDFRIRQLETRLPLLLNRSLTSAYVQVLKRIRALRMTKTGMFALFYENFGQKDLDSERK
ncbi:MAG: hypothetical protein BWY24_00759 [Microgenomates group bacterium ADurb.Bin219]|nr:MAG: hypothetical protein BWY24_00759 [Microgenomates group bacterium ADurb.Bin219]HNP89240.1 hypothetical protein [Candidatus Woesebacteria bacterium]